MSYPYNDKIGCPSCLEKGGYVDLAGTTSYNCDQTCLCRFSGERSVKDQMYFNFFVLGQPINLPPQESSEPYGPTRAVGLRKQK